VAEITLILVDDHQVVRTGLRMLLENQTDLVIVGEASSGEEAIQLVDRLRPEVVIMDITLPDISGIEATRRLKASHPEIAVVALTIHEDEQHFFEMLQAGASGYVPKRAAPQDLVAAIRAAHEGQVYLYPSLARALVSDYLSGGRAEFEPVKQEELTERETEVLELLSLGMSNDEIAARLVISRHTVARHRENLMRKLNLHSRSELVKYAIRKGLISP
jgi:two-component system, NarL family, response regulator NreC